MAVGDVRAETYLRLLVEQEIRRARPPRADAPGSVLWKLHRAGRILIAVGALDEEFLEELGCEVEMALAARSHMHPSRRAVVRNVFAPFHGSGPAGPGPPQAPAARPMRIVPLGQTLRLTFEGVSADLHFLSLAATPAQATIAVVMRMHWPPDGSSIEAELTGAGYHHLPYDRLWLADDRGARYPVTFGGEGGAISWQGVAHLSPAPPPEARWLDLIADGTDRLIRLDLRRDALAEDTAQVTTEENPGISPAGRLLTVEAEAILANAQAEGGPGNEPGNGRSRGQAPDPHPAEIVAALTQAGLVAADSPAVGRLAALCQRLGLPGPAITASAAAKLPGRWASVIARLPAGTACGGAAGLAACGGAAGLAACGGAAGLAACGGGPELFAPLATILPDVEGTRFALAGLSLAAGESFLHVAASGMPELVDRFTASWRPGFSWWVRTLNDRGADGWHVAVIAEPSARAAGDAEFRLRLVPPLTGPPDTIEVQVGGDSTRVRAVLPVRGAREGRTLRT